MKPDSSLKIEIFNQSSFQVPEELIGNCITEVISGENRQADEIRLILVDKETIRDLKKKYFQQELYTDIIAFNFNDDSDPVIEGEIYICPEIIEDNSKIYESTFIGELARVVIHGALHLCGYEDHTPADKHRMRLRENHYLEQVQMPKGADHWTGS